jgi:transposase
MTLAVRVRQRIRYTNCRVTRMVSDMHHKAASWLATNYRCVLLPTFQTSEMVRKSEQVSTADGAPVTDTEDSTTAQAAERDDVAETEGAPPTRGCKCKIHSSTARAVLSQRH